MGRKSKGCLRRLGAMLNHDVEFYNERLFSGREKNSPTN